MLIERARAERLYRDVGDLFGDGVGAEGEFCDQAERVEIADHEFGDVVAGDVLDGATADGNLVAGVVDVSQSQEQIAPGAEAGAKWAVGIVGDGLAEGHGGIDAVDGKPLVLGGEGVGDFGEGGGGGGADGQIGDVVFDDAPGLLDAGVVGGWGVSEAVVEVTVIGDWRIRVGALADGLAQGIEIGGIDALCSGNCLNGR